MSRVGNSAQYNFNRQSLSGSGRVGIRAPFGHVTIAGKAGEVQYLEVSSLYSINNPGFSIFAQAIGSDVAIAITLAPADLAVNPDQGSGLWVNSTAVTVAGGVVKLPNIATALRITFTMDAIVYIAGA